MILIREICCQKVANYSVQDNVKALYKEVKLQEQKKRSSEKWRSLPENAEYSRTLKDGQYLLNDFDIGLSSKVLADKLPRNKGGKMSRQE